MGRHRKTLSEHSLKVKFAQAGQLGQMFKQYCLAEVGTDVVVDKPDVAITQTATIIKSQFLIKQLPD